LHKNPRIKADSDLISASLDDSFMNPVQ